MPTDIHELPNRPRFGCDQARLVKLLAEIHLRQERLIGRMQALGFPLQEQAILNTLTEDVLKSSEIEGKILDREQVRSSIARRPGRRSGDRFGGTKCGKIKKFKVACDPV